MTGGGRGGRGDIRTWTISPPSSEVALAEEALARPGMGTGPPIGIAKEGRGPPGIKAPILTFPSRLGSSLDVLRGALGLCSLADGCSLSLGEVADSGVSNLTDNLRGAGAEAGVGTVSRLPCDFRRAILSFTDSVAVLLASSAGVVGVVLATLGDLHSGLGLVT